jgi:hypothetical protein
MCPMQERIISLSVQDKRCVACLPLPKPMAITALDFSWTGCSHRLGLIVVNNIPMERRSLLDTYL